MHKFEPQDLSIDQYLHISASYVLIILLVDHYSAPVAPMPDPLSAHLLVNLPSSMPTIHNHC